MVLHTSALKLLSKHLLLLKFFSNFVFYFFTVKVYGLLEMDSFCSAALAVLCPWIVRYD